MNNREKWWAVVLSDDDGTVHVVPLNDYENHDSDSGASDCECRCDPTIEWIDDETGLPLARPMVTHNAFDGRE